MADNVGISTGSHAVVATDDVGGVHYQVVKLGVGADGAASLLSTSAPAPVVLQASTNLTWVGAKPFNGVIKDDSGDDCTVKVAHLDMTTATTTDIVAAVASKKIRVIEYHINSNEALNSFVNFARGTGTTRVTGSPLHIVNVSTTYTHVQRVAPPGGFLFETASGEALRVTSSAAADISVAVVYVEVD